jgi:ferritin-like metal-binding protein YciE
MQTAHELFLHELADILDGERRLVEALEEQANNASRPELKRAFESHRNQTQKQIERLEQAFESIGEEPEQTQCKGLLGLIEEYRSFAEEDPAGDILDIFSAGAAEKVEKYEISSYESLIRMARQMKHTKAAQLLSQNLKEEQQTLKKMQEFGKKLKPENMGMEEMEEEQPRRRGRRAA